MAKITVIARDDLGYNHLYGEIRKGERYEIEAEHFDERYYERCYLKSDDADNGDEEPDIPVEIQVVRESYEATEYEDIETSNHDPEEE